MLEARDLNHAIQLISQHPGVKYGPFEIRPAADLNEMIQQSEQRRRRASRDEMLAQLIMKSLKRRSTHAKGSCRGIWCFVGRL